MCTHHTNPCLIYEYAANGSLDNFLQSDTNRACLPSNTRLSIMLDITKAVHFLHTGGCKGFNLYHRDIKSANICLSEKFTAQLIDCGLAKFVPIDKDASTKASIVNFHSSEIIFGTRGYMCPEYVYKKSRGLQFTYQPACDVYSIGVVMVELILGCLIGGQSSRNGKKFFNIHGKYVEDDSCKLIPNGWELLRDDVDPCISWRPDVLEHICKAAISCLHPSVTGRSTTKRLLQALSEAVQMTAGTSRHQNHKENSKGLICDICNQSLSASQNTTKCSEGHSLCQACMENAILLQVPRGQREAHCPFVSCTSLPFTKEEVYGFVSFSVYTAYTKSLEELHTMDSKLNDLISEIRYLNSAINQQNLQNNTFCKMIAAELKKFDILASGLDRGLSLLALLGAQHIKQCPNLVWISPVTVKSSRPKDWVKNLTMNKFLVSFICAHSGMVCHPPFEIHVSKEWVVKIAPFLQLSLCVIKAMVDVSTLSFPSFDAPNIDRFLLMESFLECMIDKQSMMCENIMVQGTITLENYISEHEVYGNAFTLIAQKALKEDNIPYWKDKLVPVCDKEKGIIWVMSKYKNLYYIC
jgi:serine/threonine protein kinase